MLHKKLIATKHREPYYWTSEGTAEIDFLIEEDHEIYPLEVKAGASSKKRAFLFTIKNTFLPNSSELLL